MSVMRHGGGGGFLQRRLTKLYTDTKTSCESVTTASKALDDPELIALHQSFQKQRDRLLAWGLDWSDDSAAQPNDIDESLTAAGFSDVVESVMSSIQDQLNEAERVQHLDPPMRPSKDRKIDPSKEALGSGPLKTQWTDDDISRSQTILSDLTACIDTLYDLSRSRRTMASSMSSSKRRARPIPASPHGSYSESKEKVQSPKQNSEQYTLSPSAIQRDFGAPFISSHHLIIQRSALQLYGGADDNNPPPYEPVAASSNSRAVGRLNTSASLALQRSTKESHVSVLVEFMPIMVDSQRNSKNSRLEKLQQSLEQLLQNAKVSHLGLLRFLGYCIDEPNARYAFLYQMPVDYFPFLRNPSDLLKELKPMPLVSLLPSPSAEDYREKRMPNLETRFRLAYDLLMSALHLRTQNAVHGNINSSNIIFFPGRTDANNDESGLAPDLRRPYLTSPARFSGDGPTPEPLSTAMYRHPEDKRNVDDDGAWAYDLYSLGLILLEIGLWAPIGRLWKTKYDRTWFKHRVEDLYVKKLGAKCGGAYLQAVQLCLDAPNFHLSTQPMTDLSLRVPQIYHYPVLDLSDPDGTFSFSMNFMYTICKILWSCCRIDIFSAPSAEELDDYLPLALVPTPEPTPENEQVAAYMSARETSLLDKKLPTIPGEQWGTVTQEKSLEKLAKKRTVKRLPNIDIPDEHLQEWNFQMMPKLSRLLQKILKESNESCGATLMMTGESAENARTTICVTCASVKKVRSALKKHFQIGRDDWDLIVLRGDIERSKVPRNKRRKPAKTRPNGSNETPFRQRELNPCYQQRPLCGASIGAFQNEEHLPPVSYGGAVLVDGMPYGLTVHHMLEAPSDDEGYENDDQDGPARSAGNWPRNTPTIPQTDLMYTHPDSERSEFNLDLEISDFEDDDDASQGPDGGHDEYWLSEDDSSDDESIDPDNDDDDAASIGDTTGIDPGEEPRLFVTQPAIDDVHEDFFPSPEDRDDEHLASHSLGYIHASSGVRRWMWKGIKHEIDWALIKVDDSRMDPRNIIIDNTTSSPTRPTPGRLAQRPPIYLNQIARMEELGGLQVLCCGRTSGLQSGLISKAMTLVKLHGRHSFSTSFCVNGNFGAPGDSGAWVFDRSNGRVCGHVLAWSEKTNTTYIAPMEVTIEDITRTLNATLVSLPGDPTQSLGYASSGSPQSAQYRYQSQQLPGDFGRLTVGGPPTPPMPPPHAFPHPHPHPHSHPHHPGFGRPPPPPPPPPRPGSREAHGFRGRMSPIPPSLLTGPRNVERQLA
ncbi:hypothetical protein N7466_009374 [Penicillium verhagenii]|uniref:uncharacterized protein n=1 Tax=Penicillium verhagenii TaxID=1562060 RepID=UPI002544D701|nr:uncharacterized protein N7466_009374 [Penicillium verhagenii]KAJ5921048.1 hypothetical protein N7466_009374 [Penicillium verhagenii]